MAGERNTIRELPSSLDIVSCITEENPSQGSSTMEFASLRSSGGTFKRAMK
jgi:hypothetical protein